MGRSFNRTKLAHRETGAGAGYDADIVRQQSVSQFFETVFTVCARRYHVDDPDCRCATLQFRSIDPPQPFKQCFSPCLQRTVRLIKVKLNFFAELCAKFEHHADCIVKAHLPFSVQRPRMVILFRKTGQVVTRCGSSPKDIPPLRSLPKTENRRRGDTDGDLFFVLLLELVCDTNRKETVFREDPASRRCLYRGAMCRMRPDAQSCGTCVHASSLRYMHSRDANHRRDFV